MRGNVLRVLALLLAVLAEACTQRSSPAPEPIGQTSQAVLGLTCSVDADCGSTCQKCSSGACVADASKSGVACNDGNACTTGEKCDAAGNCSGGSAAASGTACRPAANPCDQQETCNGSSTTCPADSFVAAGTACTDDGNPCTKDQCGSTYVQGLTGVYYNTSTLSGGSTTRVDSTVDFGWSSPPMTGVASTNFSVRWTGQVLVPNTGAYTFEIEVDDGGRLYIDNVLVIDKWFDQPATKYQFTTGSLAASSKHDIKFEYYQGGGGSAAHLRWSGPGVAYAAIPQSSLFSTSTPTVAACLHTAGNAGTVCRAAAGVCDAAETCTGTSAACPSDTLVAAGTICRAAVNECDQAETCTGASGTCPADAYKATGTACTDDGNNCTTDLCGAPMQAGLTGAYYTNTTLSGSPALTRVDSTLNFDWSATAPDPAIGLTNYSVRWTGTVTAPNTGSYTFETETDDGARLYFDGVLVIDKWLTQAASKYSYTVSLTGGTQHVLTFEYFQGSGGAVARLRWTGPSIAYAIIPATYLTSNTTGTGPGCVHAAGNAGTTCRSAAGACDAAETCTGTATLCPSDAKLPAGTVCRPVAGACDVAETCSGSSNTCPSDVLVASGTVCRAAVGNCDVAESCTGASAACPNDAFVAAGTVCRSATNECDLGEACTGTSGTCPSDAYKAAGSACTDDGNVCTSDVCGTTNAQGLSATYFASMGLTGTSVARIDSVVDFNWGTGSPDPLIPTTQYSARWTGQVLAPNTGSYTFEVEADDGVRFWFDGTLVVDKWIDEGPTKYGYTVSLTGGTNHDVKVEYYQNSGGAVARLRWTGPSISYAIIPSANLFPSAAGTTVPICNHAAINGCARGLTVTYYDNSDFTGPSVARVDATIDFDWGNGSPDPAIGSDTFSARWTGLIQPAGSGTYTFETDTDDGVRLWVNGVLLIDKFVDQGSTKYSATIDLVAGQQYDIKMDYYENSGGADAHLRLSGPGTSYGPIPNSWLFPTGDGGTSGLIPAGSGNNGTGDPYVVYQLSSTPGTAPVDVTSQSPNNWGLGNAVMMVPSFSPDGTKLVFIDGDSAGGAGWRKGVSLFDFDETNKKFSNRRLIRNTWPFGDVMKWPTFESDSRSIVFQTSTPNELCTQCDGKTGARYGNMAPTNYYGAPGTLWSVDSGAASNAVKLDKLNNGERPEDTNKSYQPTVLPVSAGGYRWVVFTSTRPYGNALNLPGTDTTCLSSQLWVAALDDATSGAADRSHPAFWLPNQNIAPISSPNYINERGFWVLDPCKPAGTGASSVCLTNEDCCGATASPPTASCRIDQPATVPPARHCVAITPNSCSADGGTCAVDNDCCGYSTSHCIAGTCKPPPPVSVFNDMSFTRDYEGVCAKGTSPVWRFFDWKAVTPSDCQIIFSAQTADTEALLDSAPSVVIGTAQGPFFPGWTGADVGAALPKQDSRHFVRITMLLKASSDGLSTPSLTDWRQSFSCVPSE